MSRKLVRRTDTLFGTGTGPEISTAELLQGPRADHLRIADIPLAWVRADPDQPRRHFDEAALASLADSIARRGLLQPVVVVAEGGQSYRLLAGERRLRAFRLLGRERIPALIRGVRDGDRLTADEVSLIENVQRVDLNAVELAGALARLGERHGYSQRDLGGIVGRDAAWVNRLLAVCGLPAAIVDAYLAAPAAVTMSALIEVAAADDPIRQRALWDAARQGATVRVLKAARAADAPVTERSRDRDTVAVVRRSLAGLRRNVDALAGHREALGAEERTQLLALRQALDALLGS